MQTSVRVLPPRTQLWLKPTFIYVRKRTFDLRKRERKQLQRFIDRVLASLWSPRVILIFSCNTRRIMTYTACPICIEERYLGGRKIHILRMYLQCSLVVRLCFWQQIGRKRWLGFYPYTQSKTLSQLQTKERLACVSETETRQERCAQSRSRLG